jgi:putative lipoprotein
MIRRLCFVLLALLAVAGCAGSRLGEPPSALRTARLQGTLTYQDDARLPTDAVVEIWLTDISALSQAMPVVVETAFLTNGRQAPLAFDLWYDPSRIDGGHRYTVNAVIRSQGQILYRSAAPAAVITQGNPTQISLTLTRPLDRNGS